MNRSVAYGLAVAIGVVAIEVTMADDAKKTAPAPALLTSGQLHEDLRIARESLEQAHPGVYRYTPKAEMDRLFERAELAFDYPMARGDFYRVVAPVIAAIKCGHTSVTLPESRDQGRAVLPLRIRVIDGKIYVFADLSTEETRSGASKAVRAQAEPGTEKQMAEPRAGSHAPEQGLAGREIRSINGIPAKRIIETMIAATPGDGNVPSSRFRRISSWAFNLNLIDLIGLKPPYDIECLDEDTKAQSKHKLEGVKFSEVRKRWRDRYPNELRSDDAAALSYFDDGSIALLKIRGFGGRAGNPSKPLGKFMAAGFEEMSAKKTKTLIIDLRDNGGGADELGKQLLSYLVDTPFQYYDDLVVNALDFPCLKYSDRKQPLPAKPFERQANGKYRMVTHPNWGTQKPSEPAFRGKVFILTNGNSFSTTSEFLSHVACRKRATFIGEESGGACGGNTSGGNLAIMLPNSKLVLNVPLMGYYMHVQGLEADRGVRPHYPVQPTIRELIAGKDREMDRALEFARKGS